MNRKQRRMAQAQSSFNLMIQLRGRSYTVEEAGALAMQEINRGNAQAAADIYNSIIAKAPSAEAYSNQGGILYEMGRYAEALVHLDKAIALNPRLDVAYNNRGNTLHKLQRYDEALASFDKAVALNPSYAEAHSNRGITLQIMKRYEEALASYAKIIALNPGNAEAYNNRGMILRAMKRYDEALANFSRAVAIKPDVSEVYNNMGNVLFDMKRLDEALASYGKAAEYEPDYADVYQNRGGLLRMMGRFDEALADFNKAVAVNPDTPYILGDVLHTKMHLCAWQGLDAVFDTLVQGLDAGKPVASPFSLLPTAVSLMQQKKCAENYVQKKYPAAASPLWKGERYAHERIRIGYFSSDFHTNHPVAHVIVEMLERHDRSRFEVTAFSFAPQTIDPLRKRLEKAFERFIDVEDRSDEAIAALARSKELDIAVDLNGLTAHARTGIFAMRPAPVQVNYLGYPGSMGAPYIDYLIADKTVIPAEHKPFYSEKIVHMPHSYWVNDTQRIIPDTGFTRQEMGLPEKGFVFCCFNKSYKITPDVFAIWMRLLHKVEGSVLWLSGGNAISMNNLRAEAEARGISGDRLVFTKRVEDMADHLARQRLADLFLDTFYYNAHTTASDALWAGVPVLTCLGQGFAGRVGASLLQAIDLPELITHSHVDYEALALELARNPERLAGIKAKLAQNRLASPLFNTALFAKHIEVAYIKMWEKTGAGALPDHIDINPVSTLGAGL